MMMRNEHKAYFIVSAFVFHQLFFAPTSFMESGRDVFQRGVIQYHPTFRPEDHPSLMPRLLFQYTAILKHALERWTMFGSVGLCSGALDCISGVLDCVSGALDCVSGALDCVFGALECVSGDLECDSGDLECVLGALECVLGALDCVSGAMECVLGPLECVSGALDCGW